MLVGLCVRSPKRAGVRHEESKAAQLHTIISHTQDENNFTNCFKVKLKISYSMQRTFKMAVKYKTGEKCKKVYRVG